MWSPYWLSNTLQRQNNHAIPHWSTFTESSHFASISSHWFAAEPLFHRWRYRSSAQLFDSLQLLDVPPLSIHGRRFVGDNICLWWRYSTSSAPSQWIVLRNNSGDSNSCCSLGNLVPNKNFAKIHADVWIRFECQLLFIVCMANTFNWMHKFVYCICWVIRMCRGCWNAHQLWRKTIGLWPLNWFRLWWFRPFTFISIPCRSVEKKIMQKYHQSECKLNYYYYLSFTLHKIWAQYLLRELRTHDARMQTRWK